MRVRSLALVCTRFICGPAELVVDAQNERAAPVDHDVVGDEILYPAKDPDRCAAGLVGATVVDIDPKVAQLDVAHRYAQLTIPHGEVGAVGAARANLKRVTRTRRSARVARHLNRAVLAAEVAQGEE